MQAPKRRRQTGSTEIEQGKLFTEKKKKKCLQCRYQDNDATGFQHY